MIGQIGNWYIHIFIVVLLTIVVWYGQATFNLAADYTLRADFFVTQGQIPIAQDYYEQALHHDPNNTERIVHLALFYIEHRNYSKALSLLTQADEMGYENRFLLQYQMGRATYYQWQYATAIPHFEAALLQIDTTAPDYVPQIHAVLLTLLGWSYLHEVGCETAVSYFENAIQISPDSGLAQSGLRRCQQ
jgi:tetratricopeptide (TPR) repeat protein